MGLAEVRAGFQAIKDVATGVDSITNPFKKLDMLLKINSYIARKMKAARTDAKNAPPAANISDIGTPIITDEAGRS